MLTESLMLVTTTTFLLLMLLILDEELSIMLLIEMLTLEELLIVSLHNLYHTHLLVYHVKEDGWEFISQTDVTELYYQYGAEPKPLLA